MVDVHLAFTLDHLVLFPPISRARMVMSVSVAMLRATISLLLPLAAVVPLPLDFVRTIFASLTDLVGELDQLKDLLLKHC